jgi:hypothetical protein
VGGKPPGRRHQLAALRAGGKLLFLRDLLTGQDFLVDTGASHSVLPYSSADPQRGPALVSVDGSPIATWGYSERQVNFAGQLFNFSFVRAQVAQPIIGMDFLAHFKLLVDPFGHRVLHAGSLAPLACAPHAPRNSTWVATLRQLPVMVRNLLAEFPTLVPRSGVKERPLHGVAHSIETTGKPVFAKARRLDPGKYQQAREEFQRLEAAGIVRRSDSAWSSPLHMVLKADGTWRPCGDYRRLNNVTVHAIQFRTFGTLPIVCMIVKFFQNWI